jgi:acyl carrier protein
VNTPVTGAAALVRHLYATARGLPAGTSGQSAEQDAEDAAPISIARRRKGEIVSAASDVDVMTPTTGTRWDSVLAGIRADALDCLQSTVAIIADDAYGSGAHLALGCRWRFPTRDSAGTIGVQPSVSERSSQAAEVLGLDVDEPHGPLGSSELRRLADTAPIYIVAEAYELRWLPYARATTRYRRMPHSFLLESGPGGYTVVDGYYADTEWGRARPSVWTLSAAEFDRAVEGEGIALRMTATAQPPRVDPAVVMASNAMTAKAAGPDIDAYIDTVRATLAKPEGIERLVLDIWHLCRERLLYTVWLENRGFGEPVVTAAARAAQAWQQLAGQSYLASRRALRGAPPNVALVEDMARLLHSDAELMASLAETASIIDRTAAAEAVLEALAVTLQLDAAEVQPISALRSLPGFDSFKLVQVIDLAEARLGVEFPSDASAADLADVAGLCRLFGRAAKAKPS